MKLSVSKDLDALRGDALRRIDISFLHRRQALGAINADIWAAKEAEARRVLDGENAGLLLVAEAVERRTPVQTLAREIVQRADARAGQFGALEAERQIAQRRVRAATVPAEIEAIAVEVEAGG